MLNKFARWVFKKEIKEIETKSKEVEESIRKLWSAQLQIRDQLRLLENKLNSTTVNLSKPRVD